MRFAGPRRAACSERATDGIAARLEVAPKARRLSRQRPICRVQRPRDRGELDFFLAHTPAESMVQAVCLGDEYSIDVFCDLEDRCLNAIPRTMIESKGASRSRV